MTPSFFPITIVNKGISNNLMKAGAKRRRTKQEIKQEKHEEDRKNREIVEKMGQIEQMEQQILQLKQQQHSQQLPPEIQEKLELQD